MTKEEVEILSQLSIINKRIKKLPALFDDGGYVKRKVQDHINSLHLIVLAREGVRNYKKLVGGDLIQQIQAGDSDRLFEKILKATEEHTARNTITPTITIPKKKQTTKKKKDIGVRRVKKVPAGMTVKEQTKLKQKLTSVKPAAIFTKKKPPYDRNNPKSWREPFSKHPA